MIRPVRNAWSLLSPSVSPGQESRDFHTYPRSLLATPSSYGFGGLPCEPGELSPSTTPLIKESSDLLNAPVVITTTTRPTRTRSRGPTVCIRNNHHQVRRPVHTRGRRRGAPCPDRSPRSYNKYPWSLYPPRSFRDPGIYCMY